MQPYNTTKHGQQGRVLFSMQFLANNLMVQVRYGNMKLLTIG